MQCLFSVLVIGLLVGSTNLGVLPRFAPTNVVVAQEEDETDEDGEGDAPDTFEEAPIASCAAGVRTSAILYEADGHVDEEAAHGGEIWSGGATLLGTTYAVAGQKVLTVNATLVRGEPATGQVCEGTLKKLAGPTITPTSLPASGGTTINAAFKYCFEAADGTCDEQTVTGTFGPFSVDTTSAGTTSTPPSTPPASDDSAPTAPAAVGTDVLPPLDPAAPTVHEEVAKRIFGLDTTLEALPPTELIALEDLRRAAAQPEEATTPLPELDVLPAPNAVPVLKDADVTIGDGKGVTTQSIVETAPPPAADAPQLSFEAFRAALDAIPGIQALAVWRDEMSNKIVVRFTNEVTHITSETTIDQLTTAFLKTFTASQQTLIFDTTFDEVFQKHLSEAVAQTWDGHTELPTLGEAQFGEAYKYHLFTYEPLKSLPVLPDHPDDMTLTGSAATIARDAFDGLSSTKGYGASYLDRVRDSLRSRPIHVFTNLQLSEGEFGISTSIPWPQISWNKVFDTSKSYTNWKNKEQKCGDPEPPRPEAVGQPPSSLYDRTVFQGQDLIGVQDLFELRKDVQDLEQFRGDPEKLQNAIDGLSNVARFITPIGDDELITANQEAISSRISQSQALLRKVSQLAATQHERGEILIATPAAPAECITYELNVLALYRDVMRRRARIETDLRTRNPARLSYRTMSVPEYERALDEYELKKQNVMKTAMDRTLKTFSDAKISTACTSVGRCLAITDDKQDLAAWAKAVQTQLGQAVSGSGFVTLPPTMVPVVGEDRSGDGAGLQLIDRAMAQEAETLPALTLVPTNYLKITTNGAPVGILVTDPAGRNVGYNPVDGGTVTNVEGATYEGVGGAESTLTVPGIVDGNYSIAFIPLADGAVTGSIELAIGDQLVTKPLSLTMASGTTQRETIEVDLTVDESPIAFTGRRDVPTWVVTALVVTAVLGLLLLVWLVRWFIRHRQVSAPAVPV
ncbi:hypothetical protein HY374_04180 [Candidatus Berkelbacteria bacterium]|nr:hypothetical protein [Candidatus Berkelbacteria bacterium]